MSTTEWRKKNLKNTQICFNKKTDEELLDFLEYRTRQLEETQSGYIKSLIKEDMEKERKVGKWEWW